MLYTVTQELHSQSAASNTILDRFVWQTEQKQNDLGSKTVLSYSLYPIENTLTEFILDY